VFRLIVYLTIFLLTTLIGCSSNTPEDIVSKYIKGVQNFEARKVWESSNYNFLDETLLPEEKDKIFQEYKIDFDKRKKQIFNIFPHSAKYKIFSKKNVSENETEVFVKVNYDTNEPYKANELKSATIIKVKFGVKTYKNGKSIRSLTVDSIINHNKDFDNQKLTNDLLLVSESNPEDAYKKCSDIVKGDEEYFSDLKQNCKKIYTLWEKQKKEVLKKELLMDADEFIYIEDQSYKYNTASYRTEDIHYSEHDGDLTYHRTIPGSTHTEIYGVDIMAKIKSKFKQRKVRTQVTIWAKSKEGADRALFGSVYWGNKVINDSFYIEVPPKGIAISKYYSLETGITKTTGLLGGIGAALDPKTGKTGTYLESGPIISLSKADKEKKIEGKAIWEKKRAEISLVFEKLKKTNSDPTVSAKDKLAKWNNFYKSIEDDIIGVSKDNEYREETNKFIAHWEWETAAPEIKAAYDNAMDKDSDENLAADLKLKAWTEFINSYQKDFNGTNEDDELWKEAEKKALFWSWEVEAPRMLAAFNAAMVKDYDENLSAFIKKNTWNVFLSDFRSDHSVSEEDDELREKAKNRETYWSYSNLAERLHKAIMAVDGSKKLQAKSKLAAWKDYKKKLMFHYPDFAQKNDSYFKTTEERIQYWNWVVEEPTVEKRFKLVLEKDKNSTLSSSKKLGLWKDFEKLITNSPKNHKYRKKTQERIAFWNPSAVAKREEKRRTVRESKDKRLVEYVEGYTLDKKTGIMWLLDQKISCYWEEIPKKLDEVRKTKPAGYSDWRIPSEKEFITLLYSQRQRYWPRNKRSFSFKKFDPVIKNIFNSNTTLNTTTNQWIDNNWGHFWTNTQGNATNRIETFFYSFNHRRRFKDWNLEDSVVYKKKARYESKTKGFLILIRK
jgi:hypothetical protein